MILIDQKTLPMSTKKILTSIDQKPVTVSADWKPLVDVGKKILPTDID